MKKTTIVLLLILLTCFSINAQSPTAICKDITVQLDGTGNVTITPEQVNNESTGIEPVTLSLNITAFDCADVGPQTVTLTVTDGDSNTDTCTATVTVENQEPVPTIADLPTLTDPCYVEVTTLPEATDCNNDINNPKKLR